MGRQPCCEKVGLKRGLWTIEEDQKLINFISNNGIQCWHLVPQLAGLMRCGKSCRLRWTNYLRPDLKRGAFSEAEEDQIIQLHSRLGNRWSKIASNFPGRTDNEIKNHWNTRIKKRLKLFDIDPATHKPIQQLQPERSHDSATDIKEDNEGKVTGTNEENQDREEKENVRGSLDSGEEMRLPPEAIDPSIAVNSSSSISLMSLSDGSNSSTLDGSNFCWDSTVDSLPPWEALYYLHDVLYFSNYP